MKLEITKIINEKVFIIIELYGVEECYEKNTNMVAYRYGYLREDIK